MKIPTQHYPSTSTNGNYSIETTTELLNGQIINAPYSTVTTPTVPKEATKPTKNNSTIPQTLNGETDWHAILQKDLQVSDSEEDSPKLATVAVNTATQINPARSAQCNTLPLCIVDMGNDENVSDARIYFPLHSTSLISVCDVIL